MVGETPKLTAVSVAVALQVEAVGGQLERAQHLLYDLVPRWGGREFSVPCCLESASSQGFKGVPTPHVTPPRLNLNALHARALQAHCQRTAVPA
jgi:hypothetical protein